MDTEPRANLAKPAVRAGSIACSLQPTLTSGDLALRPWQIGDVPALVSAYQDPEIRRWHVRTMTPDQAVDWIAERGARWRNETGADWAVVSAGTLVGRAGLRRIVLEEGWGEVAYWVTPSARTNRVATRALSTVIHWAFHDIDIHRLELAHSTLNEASCRVAANAGFRYEGTKRRQGFHADGWHDMHLHSLLSEDTISRRAAVRDAGASRRRRGGMTS